MSELLKLWTGLPNKEALFLIGPLLVVPVGLTLAAPTSPARGRWRFAARFHGLAVVALVASFAMPKGEIAAALSAPWLVFTALLAALGLLRFLERGPGPPEELAIDAALVFPVVGAAWLLFSRLGKSFLGFGEPTVLLTAAHFHFAGFALPLLTGLAGRVVPGRHATIASIGVVTGVPFVAAGITFAAKGYEVVELAAAWWLSAAAIAAALLIARAALAVSSGNTRAALLASAACLVAGMALASLYGMRSWFAVRWLDLDTMVRWHATANAIGFSLLGVIAWRLGMPASEPRRRGFHLLVAWMGDEPDLEAWESRPIAAASEAGPREGDPRDVHEDTLAREPPGGPAPKGGYEHAASIVLRYDVFPPTLLERVLRRTPVQVGDTLGVSYALVAGLRVFFAVRVVKTFDERGSERSRSGFVCRTLEGHPLAGEETFAVEKDGATGVVRVSFRSWSRPTGFVARVLRPVIRSLQVRAGRAGLAWLKQGSQW